MIWFFQIAKKYTTFSGRMDRIDYIDFVVFTTFGTIILTLVDAIIGTLYLDDKLGLLSGIFAAAILLPGTAVTVRRLHDTDRRGWWILINLIPIAGTIALIVYTVERGTHGPNRFGAEPFTALPRATS